METYGGVLQWTVHDGLIYIGHSKAMRHVVDTRVYRLRRPVPNIEKQIEAANQQAALANAGGAGYVRSLGPAVVWATLTHRQHLAVEKNLGNVLVWVAAELPPARRSRAVGVDRVVQALDQPVDFSFAEASLAEVCKTIERSHEVKVEIDADTAHPIDHDLALSMKLRDVRLSVALRGLLVQHGLHWKLTEDRLVITNERSSRSEADQTLVTVDYDVRRILPAEYNANIGSLIHNHLGKIDGGTWERLGGPGKMQAIPPGIIRVEQTYWTQLKIRQFMADLALAASGR
jgi:hypothetical protein